MASKRNYRMPAEWEPHEATWLTWPHNAETWPPEVLPRMELFWARLAAELSVGESVRILVPDAATEDRAWAILEMAGAQDNNIKLYKIPSNDAWMRDHGPIFVFKEQEGGASQEIVVLNWDYNAWGGKYPPFDLDDQIPQKVADQLRLPSYKPKMVLEGGSIEVNGQGLLMTTEACLLNDNRNLGFSQEDIEERLQAYLGISEVLWLGKGVVGDDTDGHVDNLARFVGPQSLVTVAEENPTSANYALLQDNYQRLISFCEKQGGDWQLIKLPMPKPLEFEGSILPASYANFYIANEVVLVPIFDCPQDVEALEILKKIFNDRRVEGLYCQDLLIGLGGIHCITQQQPRLPSGV